MSLEIDYESQPVAKRAPEPVASPIELGGRSTTAKFLGVFFTKRRSLFWFVILPAALAGIYYFGIASGQYVSETRLVVRTIGVSEQFDTSEKREGRSIIGGDSLTQDSYIVANFLESPQIVRKLENKIGLRQYFTKPSIDFLSRFPQDASFEDLHSYWQNHVDTYVDGPSGIIIFTLRAFSPEDTVAISKAALAAADDMIDNLSEKAKADLVRRVELDVTSSLNDYRQSLDDLRDYQNKTGILDPISSAKMTSTIIAKLTEEKLKLTIDLKSLEAAKAGDNVRGRQLKRAIEALDDQIALRQNSLAGTSPVTGPQLSSSLTEFSRLETRRIAIQAIYEATVRNLDTARSTALKRTTFMSIFSDSNLPEKPKYPDRFSEWLMLTAGFFTLWITATLIWMSIEDHRV